jgi:hypothetical protein
MKKIDLGQTISIFANLGVIAGIAFLGYEMQQNTTALQSTAGQNINNQIAAIYEIRMQPEQAAIILKGNNHPDELTPVEQIQYDSWNSMILQAWQNMYFQARTGAYDEQLAEGWWVNLIDSFQSPGFRGTWERSVTLSDEFRRFVEEDLLGRVEQE